MHIDIGRNLFLSESWRWKKVDWREADRCSVDFCLVSSSGWIWIDKKKKKKKKKISAQEIQLPLLHTHTCAALPPPP
jgi:hypothetical protein